MMSIADYTENKTSLLYYFALLKVYLYKEKLYTMLHIQLHIHCYVANYVLHKLG